MEKESGIRLNRILIWPKILHMLHFYTRSLTASFLRLLLTFGCFENHGLHGNTRTILKVNVYDFLETLKFKDINGCQ